MSAEERDAVNIRVLAGTIEAEARGTSEVAKVAVGSVLHNRMLRNDKQMVAEITGFAHPIAPKSESLAIATGILHGTIKDPTNGATHFYTPQLQPKVGEPIPKGADVRGGPESVLGVNDKQGQPIMNLKPGWAADADHEQRIMPSIPERQFKFYKQRDDGKYRHVR